MKATREQAAASRERILDVASRRFRERGLDGIGVADLMQDAGLTHGGFYGHFASKEELMTLACSRALAKSVELWTRLSQRDGKAVTAIAKAYLSTRHRDDPGAGCVLPSLAADVARHGPTVRHALTEGVASLVEVLAAAVPGRTRAIRRKKALAIFASMAGGLMLARAVDDAQLSQEILDAVLAEVETAAS